MKKYVCLTALMAIALTACDNSEDNGLDNASRFVMDIPANASTSEDGQSVEFGIKLGIKPEGAVKLSVASDNPKEGTVSPSSLSFDENNWDTVQKVTVTGVADDVADGDQKYHVILSVLSSDDPRFANFSKTIELTNLDNGKTSGTQGTVPDKPEPEPGQPGVLIAGDKILMTNESGKQASFSLTLNTKPSADVVIKVSGTPSDEFKLDLDSVTFNAQNWNIPQRITVTGLDDEEEDGNQRYTIQMTAESADPAYQGIDIEPVHGVNGDNDGNEDIRPFSVLSDDIVATNEYGTRGYLVFELKYAPAYDVHVKVEVSRPDEVFVETPEIIVTPENGHNMHEIILTGLDDDKADGDQQYDIKIVSITSDDPFYNNVEPYDFGKGTPSRIFHGINYDNENKDNMNGLVVKKVSSSVTKQMRDLNIDATVTEDGDYAIYSVNLKSAPQTDEQIFISGLVTDSTEGRVEPQTVVFNRNNWDKAQNFTIYGVDDDEIDGDVLFGVRFVSYSDDLSNNDLSSDTYILKNIDNDGTLEDELEPTLVIRKQFDVLYTNENGTTRPFYISLNRQPKADVKVYLRSTDKTEGILSNLVNGVNAYIDPANPKSDPYILFTPLDWNVEREILIQGVDDDAVDGNRDFDITFTVRSDDEAFNRIETESVKCRNFDNDAPGSTKPDKDVYVPNSDLIVVSGLDRSGVNTLTDDGLTFRISLAKRPTSAHIPVRVTFSNAYRSNFDANNFVVYKTSNNTVYDDTKFLINQEDWDKEVTVTVLPNPFKAKVADGTTDKLRILVDKKQCTDPSFVDGVYLDPIDLVYHKGVTNKEDSNPPVQQEQSTEEQTETGTPRLVFSPNICSSNSVISEGTSQKYAIKLASQPKNNVYVKFSIPEEFADRVKLKNNKSNLTFKPSNYDVEQYIEVIGQANADNAQDLITLNYTFQSADASFNGEDPYACSMKLVHASSMEEFTPEVKKTRKIRIMAANITSGPDQLYETAGLNMLKAMDPDIILIQEFAGSAQNVIDELSAYFKTDYHFYTGAGRIGNGIITKGDLTIKETFSKTSIVPTINDREYDAAIIDLPGDKDMIAVSLHLYTKCSDSASAEAIRPSQRSEYSAVASFIREIQKDGNYYVAIGGDFNSRTTKYLEESWSGLVATNSAYYPTDQNGNYRTNAPRMQHYDWVLVDPQLQSQSMPMIVGDRTYPYGYVLDSRVQKPLSAIAPVQYKDSGAQNMQHMPIVRDFWIEY